MQVIEFEMPGLPPLQNIALLVHRMKRYRLSQEWHELVWAYASPQRPSKPFRRYQLSLTRFSSSEPDYDGLVASFKWVVDGLKHAQIIQDDKLSQSGPWNCSWIKCKKKEGKIRVRVESRD